VDIHFDSDKTRALYNDSKKLIRIHNAQRAKLIRRRLDELRAARTLEVMRNLPGRTHELKADRAGQISIDLDGPYRLIFVPSHETLPRKPDGGLDWAQVTAILIKEVTDTHD
jgi:plasmid maintenance system killer protein